MLVWLNTASAGTDVGDSRVISIRHSAMSWARSVRRRWASALIKRNKRFDFISFYVSCQHILHVYYKIQDTYLWCIDLKGNPGTFGPFAIDNIVKCKQCRPCDPHNISWLRWCLFAQISWAWMMSYKTQFEITDIVFQNAKNFLCSYFTIKSIMF